VFDQRRVLEVVPPNPKIFSPSTFTRCGDLVHAARVPALNRACWQIDVTAIRKFEVLLLDAAPSTFDDVTRSDRKPARQTINLKTTDLSCHGISLNR
jgi:hypothetical protein